MMQDPESLIESDISFFDFFYLFDYLAGQFLLEMLVAGHFLGIHPGDAIVHMVASAAVVGVGLHLVDEIGLIEQSAPHLQEFEPLIYNLVGSLAVDHATHIYEGHLQLTAESAGILKEIEGLEMLGTNHVFPGESDSIFEPELLHVVGHCPDGHFAAHHIHRGFAHKTSGKHHGMHAVLLNLLCHSETVVDLKAALEAVAHVGLHDNPHVGFGGFHHFVETHVHESHTVLETASEFIAAMVGVRGEELGDKISMAGVNLHAVETGVAGSAHGIAEVYGKLLQFILAKAAADSGGIEVEPCVGSHGDAACGADMGHVAAVADLDRGFCPAGVDAIGDFAQRGHYFGAKPELRVERECGAADAGVSEGCHADSTFGHTPVIVAQLGRRVVVFAHSFECGGAYRAVAQFHGAYFAGSE